MSPTASKNVAAALFIFSFVTLISLLASMQVYAQPADVRIRAFGGCGPFLGPFDGNVGAGGRLTYVVEAKSDALQDAANLSFRIYSPNMPNLSFEIISTNPSAQWTSSSGYWQPAGGGLTFLDNDGILPEVFSLQGAAVGGGGFLANSFTEVLSFTVRMPSQSGAVICVDSIVSPPAADWLMSPGGPPTLLAGSGDGVSSSSALCFETFIVPCGFPEITSCPDTVSGSYCGPISFKVEANDPLQGMPLVHLPLSSGAGTVSADADGNVTYQPAVEDTNSVVEIITEVVRVDCCNPVFCTTYVNVTHDSPHPFCPPDVLVLAGNTHILPAPIVQDNDTCEDYRWTLFYVNPLITGNISVDSITGVVTYDSDRQDCCDTDVDVCLEVSDGLSASQCCFVISYLGATALCCNTPGDADNSGMSNIGDVTFLISYIFAGGPTPVCCASADAMTDGSINIADVTHLISYIFSGGFAPGCGPNWMSCD